MDEWFQKMKIVSRISSIAVSMQENAALGLCRTLQQDQSQTKH